MKLNPCPSGFRSIFSGFCRSDAIERLGSNRLIPVDLRVVAASKVDLREASERGSFREDLYYRLNVVCLEIPPLRERREDIPLLFHHFLLVAGHQISAGSSDCPVSQMNALLSYSWPGNVRELRNFAERYVLLGRQFDWSLEKMFSGEEKIAKQSLAEQVDCFERDLIEHALVSSNGSIKDVMVALAMPRKTLYDKMRKYGLKKSDYK